jgi:hypothetical protein
VVRALARYCEEHCLCGRSYVSPVGSDGNVFWLSVFVINDVEKRSVEYWSEVFLFGLVTVLVMWFGDVSN